jgi:hypothetical protein
MRSIFLFFACAFTAFCSAQYKWAAGVNYIPGFLYAHTDDARNLEAHTQAFDISVSRINNRDHYWDKYYKNAQIGYNFLYMDLGKPKLTGKVYSLGISFQFRISGKDARHLALRMGTGIGYLTEKFDPYKNRSNMAIGSHFNGSIQLGLIYQTRLGSRMALRTGLGLIHFSNGSINVPNLGVNMPSLYLGLQYAYKKTNEPVAGAADKFPTTMRKHELLLNYAYKERFTAKPRPFNIVSAGYRWIKPINMIRRWYLGADLVWDPTHPYNHDLKNKNPRVGIDNSTEFGVLIGHRYDIGRLGLITDVGFYILNPYQTKAFTYQRIGFRYEVNKNWFLNSTLKIHFGTADYFEWGIGYKLDKFKK